MMTHTIRARITSLVRKLWLEYCEENSISTIKFLITKNQGLIDRVWWMIWIVMAIILGVFSAISTYIKWMDNPVYISYATQLISVRQVPFPAVTICTTVQNRIDSFNLTDSATRFRQNVVLKDSEYINIRALAHVCPYVSDWISFNDKLSVSTVDILKKLAVNASDLLGGWMWANELYSSNTLWPETITDSGICFTFNAVAAENLYRLENLHNGFSYSGASGESNDWFRESGYRSDSNLDAHPKRALGPGIPFGLWLELFTFLKDEDLFCNGPSNGFKILVHPPDEVPTLDHSHYRLGLGDTMTLTIKPQTTTTSSALRSQSVQHRQCFFENERYLRFFKIYNQHNCIQECLANFTYSLCGCVKFSMPRSVDMRECDASEIDCYSGAHMEMYARTVGKINDHPCGCLPACTSLSYDVEISSQPFDVAATLNARGTKDYGIDYTLLRVNIKDKWILATIRQELMGFSDSVGNLGGLFGLMMGASLMSILEIVYFCLE
ncbi:pickpocket protein 28-like [Uranotaenia lowii]|uniref:pickpocket protein 28-like n=1 Tax=Uranotaenia lowii TaxID=190385 RepID=UPI002479B863|nr:pickpocket protein 28-like [Uranotaenia lowii]